MCVIPRSLLREVLRSMSPRHRRRRAPVQQAGRRARLTPVAAVLGGGGTIASVFLASWVSWLVVGLLVIALVVVGGVLWAVFSRRNEPFARVTELARLAKGEFESSGAPPTVIEAHVVRDTPPERPSLEGVKEPLENKEKQPKRQIQRRRGNA